ncbi:ECF transporter S component [Clostridium sp. Marseille-P2415]|uniref:ECF transporter S component n=1 Tax=Clostridium sp. Marseille-P2415 TaxID=1805471 RepID=UPI00135665BC|nr:ECF transporter S component [Clostridium sp. Marseille-P2415]
MNDIQTEKILFGALMTALTAAATMLIHIPSAFNGYIHLGDGMVLLSGILQGPLYGAAAGGLGSMLADLLSGYAFYAPATFIIKALAAYSGGYLYHRLSHSSQTARWLLPFLAAGIVSSTVVTGGYFIFELIIYNLQAAMINIPFNLVQNLFSLIVAGSLLPLLLRRR